MRKEHTLCDAYKLELNGWKTMADIHQKVFSHISGRIYGVAGYCSDNDSTQHVLGATYDGELYEIHWNSNTSPTSPQWLAHFDGIASLCGFYTSDDNFQHVIVATRDGRLDELYFMQPLPQDVQWRSPLYQLGTTLGPGIGMAGFFSADDNLRHATVGGADNILHEIVWKATVNHQNLATQFTLRDVAGIAGFFALDIHSRNVVVAMEGGDVFNVHYGGAILAGGSITTDLLTTFSGPPLVNVAAFVSTDTDYRHVITLNSSGQLHDYSFIPGSVFGQTLLATIGNVVDIVGYYSAYDKNRHVIVATGDGDLHEIYYGQLG
jgi:hypothetical protein